MKITRDYLLTEINNYKCKKQQLEIAIENIQGHIEALYDLIDRIDEGDE